MTEKVSCKLNIRVDKSKDILRVTTQKGVLHAVHPSHRIYRVGNMQLNRKLLNTQFYTDHLLDKTKFL